MLSACAAIALDLMDDFVLPEGIGQLFSAYPD
jgi:hypothetical protein